MNENNVAETWMLFREYIDSKQIEIAAEKYIDLCADQGIDDQTMIACIGTDAPLDQAVRYYLDLDEDEDEED